METTAYLTVPGQLTSIRVLRQWLREVLTRWQVANESQCDLLLAVTEICTNIIRHGYKNQIAGDILVHLSRRDNAVHITLWDTAPIFIPRHIVPPPPEILAEGGYGLFLIDALMDEMLFERASGRINRTTLVKHDPPRPRASTREPAPGRQARQGLVPQG